MKCVELASTTNGRLTVIVILLSVVETKIVTITIAQHYTMTPVICGKRGNKMVVVNVMCKDCYAYGQDKEIAMAKGLNEDEYCALLQCEMPEYGFCYYGYIASGNPKLKTGGADGK